MRLLQIKHKMAPEPLTERGGSTPGKPRILVLCASYLPGYKRGGPTQSVAAIVNNLSEDFSFFIVTEDRDRGDSKPYPLIRSSAWNKMGPAHVFYVSVGPLDFLRIARVVRSKPHDVIYHNSFLDFRFSIFLLILRQLSSGRLPGLIIAPRGEFSPGALQIKPLKKRLFLAVARRFGIYDQVLWHASTSDEAENVYSVMGSSARVLVARNFPSIKSDQTETVFAVSAEPHREDGAALRVCFLSRISRKKNLDYLIRVMSKMRYAAHLSIYGPIEDGEYWLECQRLINLLPQHISAVYYGAIEHNQVAATIASHDVFSVPSLGENFGHVFLEAWSVGVPVLISDQTPWHRLKERSVGWDISLADPAGFVKSLEEAGQWNDLDLARVRRACLNHAAEVMRDPSTYTDNRRLFELGVQLRRL